MVSTSEEACLGPLLGIRGNIVVVVVDKVRCQLQGSSCFLEDSRCEEDMSTEACSVVGTLLMGIQTYIAVVVIVDVDSVAVVEAACWEDTFLCFEEACPSQKGP